MLQYTPDPHTPLHTSYTPPCTPVHTLTDSFNTSYTPNQFPFMILCICCVFGAPLFPRQKAWGHPRASYSSRGKFRAELRGLEIGKDRLCWVSRLGLHCTVVPITDADFHIASVAHWMYQLCFIKPIWVRGGGAMLRRALACVQAPCFLTAASAV